MLYIKTLILSPVQITTQILWWIHKSGRIMLRSDLKIIEIQLLYLHHWACMSLFREHFKAIISISTGCHRVLHRHRTVERQRGRKRGENNGQNRHLFLWHGIVGDAGIINTSPSPSWSVYFTFHSRTLLMRLISWIPYDFILLVWISSIQTTEECL